MAIFIGMMMMMINPLELNGIIFFPNIFRQSREKLPKGTESWME